MNWVVVNSIDAIQMVPMGYNGYGGLKENTLPNVRKNIFKDMCPTIGRFKETWTCISKCKKWLEI